MLALAFVVGAATTPAFSQDAPAAAELLRRAIEAHGGAAALGSLPHLELTGTVESFGRRAGAQSDLLARERADGAYRREVVVDFRGRKTTMIEFYDGETRKRRFRTSWDDLPTVEADEAKAHRLNFLLTIDAAAATVDGAGLEGDRRVWLLSVPDGRGRAVLALDQESGLLLSLAYPGTSAAGMGTKEDVQRKLEFRDHRPVGDLLLPFDVATLEDGSATARVRYATIVRLDAFDPAWLTVPDPTRRFVPPEELAF
jgi:hypothetical protein